MMYKYLETIETTTKEVVLRIDVTGQSDRNIEKAESGMNYNLNHNENYTELKESETELPKI